MDVSELFQVGMTEAKIKATAKVILKYVESRPLDPSTLECIAYASALIKFWADEAKATLT
ncbi:hypothetical protein [Paraburkholderia caribensis]|uniref:hypothetical protein n=1 Tax=Paraburkholderia caribensis TaxID=75105 RepID=UPI0031E20C2F